MKIYVIGTRGIPDIPGGVETHCEMLYPLLVQLGCRVYVAARTPYITKKHKKWQGVEIVNCYAPRHKLFEAVVHTFLALLKAPIYKPDLIHIHSIGPALLTPLARLLGYTTVFTNHGPDYKRQKWGSLAKLILYFGEYLGCRFSNKTIAISRTIKTIVKQRCNREACLIHNGVSLPPSSHGYDYLSRLGIKPKKYFLTVARFVPEKGIHDLIRAYKGLKTDFMLVIAGDADHPTQYSKLLKKEAEADPRIILTGFIQGGALHQLYYHAGLFVLPSYHEGLPIALLEAMSHGLSILASDIVPNLETGLRSYRYFKCGNIDDLGHKMDLLSQKGIMETERQEIYNTVMEKYNWLKIAQQTMGVYRKVCSIKK